MKNAHTANDTGTKNNTKCSQNYTNKFVTLPPANVKRIKQILPPKCAAMFNAVHNNQGILTHQICQGVYLNNAPDVARKANTKLRLCGLELKCLPPAIRLKGSQQSWHWFLVEVDK